MDYFEKYNLEKNMLRYSLIFVYSFILSYSSIFVGIFYYNINEVYSYSILSSIIILNLVQIFSFLVIYRLVKNINDEYEIKEYIEKMPYMIDR